MAWESGPTTGVSTNGVRIAKDDKIGVCVTHITSRDLIKAGKCNVSQTAWWLLPAKRAASNSANEPSECKASEVGWRAGVTIFARASSALVRIVGTFIATWNEKKG